MKQVYHSLVALATASLLLLGCTKEDKGPEATNLDPASITATPGIGRVKLAWAIPPGANYKYVQVSYLHPGSQKQHKRLASVHADTLLVDGLKNLYGPIEFTLQPVTKYGKVGTAHKITATAEVIPIEARVEKTPIALSADGVWANDPDPNSPPFSVIVDGNNTTFYHGNYRAGRKPLPGYVVVDMKEPLGAFSFSWHNRHNKNIPDNPSEVEVLVSKEFDGQNFTPEAFSAVSVTTLNNLPRTKDSEFEIEPQFLSDKYRYLWIKVKSITSGTDFFTVAEIRVNKCRRVIYNPETEETTIVE